METKLDQLRALLKKYHEDFYQHWPTGAYSKAGGPAWKYQRDMGRMEGVEDAIAVLIEK